jgi:peptidoglycan/LPS O-acetylase OafA/YrhL/lysophospholipase L1-like esterase
MVQPNLDAMTSDRSDSAALGLDRGSSLDPEFPLDPASPEHRSPSEAPPVVGRLGHVPALDGIRGIAVLAVIAHHLDHMAGGYLGVDAFFVLSGFLITGLLVDEARFGKGTAVAGGTTTGRIDLGRFWTRRVKRLFPALALFLVVVVIVEAFVVDGARTLRREVFASLFYLYNWNALVEGIDYWSSLAAPSPLRHMWSLAIEEQFYLLWPLVVVAVFALVRRRSPHGSWTSVAMARVGVVAAVLAVASMAVAQLVYDPNDVLRVYYGSDARFAAILFGATAAVIVRRLPEPSAAAQRVVGVAGLVLLIPLAWMWISLEGTSTLLYRGGLIGAGLAVTFVVAAVVIAPASGLARLMSIRPLRWCGLISYGLYLWHWPIIVWITPERTGLEGVSLFAVRTTLTVGVTLASYFLLEQPIRRSSIGNGRTALSAMAVLVGVLAITLFATASMKPALEQPAAGTRSTVPIPPPPPEASQPEASPGSPIAPDLAPAQSGSDGEPTGPRPLERLMVVGDSGAWFLGEQLATDPPPGVIVLPRGVVGCGIANVGGGSVTDDGTFLPDPEGCENWPTDWQADLQAFQPDHVLLALSWPGIGNREVDGELVHPCEAAFDEFYAQRMARAIEVAGSTGADVVVATAPYYVGAASSAISPERIDCLNEIMVSTSRALGASVLDLARWTCPGTECRDSIDGAELRPDGLHFDGEGGQIAADWIFEQLLAGTTGSGTD